MRFFARDDAALATLDAEFAGVVVTDIRMPQMDGLELLAAVRTIHRDISIILVTGDADIATAARAMRDGAADFLTEPFPTDRLIAAARRPLARRLLVTGKRRLGALADPPKASEPLIGDSPPIRCLRHSIAQLAAADVDVLVEGETGTNKEPVAPMLHRQGPWRSNAHHLKTIDEDLVYRI